MKAQTSSLGKRKRKKKKEGEQPSSEVSATTKITVTLSYF